MCFTGESEILIVMICYQFVNNTKITNMEPGNQKVLKNEKK